MNQHQKSSYHKVYIYITKPCPITWKYTKGRTLLLYLEKKCHLSPKYWKFCTFNSDARFNVYKTCKTNFDLYNQWLKSIQNCFHLRKPVHSWSDLTQWLHDTACIRQCQHCNYINRMKLLTRQWHVYLCSVYICENQIISIRINK